MLFQIISPKYGTKYVRIDDEDWDKIKKHRWYLSFYKKIDNFYVATYNKDTRKTLKLHRFIMNCPDLLIIDHKDGNTLNNCKYNLRICTHSENMSNSFKRQKNSTSKYKGVYWHNRKKIWISQIRSKNHQIFLGNFKNELDAAKAYNEAALKYHGEFARLNKI